MVIRENTGYMQDFEFVKNCWKDETLRRSFNELSEKTFGINFEDWYQNGFWSEKYIPYSMIKDGRVAANVSVNLMNFIWNGENRHFIQLGTVMTQEDYRNKGLIRYLMQKIEKDYEEKAEGIYLFANDSVLSFYPKFGFEKAAEYQYSKEVNFDKEKTAVLLPMKEKRDWEVLEQAIAESVNYSQLQMVDNIPLIMFYITKFMQDSVYYVENLDAYIIAEREGETLLVHGVYSKKLMELDMILEAFGREVKRVILGFVPREREGCIVSETEEEDTVLFLKGKGMQELKKHEIMFPTLSHA